MSSHRILEKARARNAAFAVRRVVGQPPKSLVVVLLTAVLALVLPPAVVRAEPPVVPTLVEAATFLGFTDSDIARIERGDIVSRDLREGSDEELAGVVAVLFAKPLTELEEIALEGRMLESDHSIRKFHVWKPSAPTTEAFAELGLDASESREADFFLHASAGSRLNLSDQEVQRFNNLQPRRSAKDPETLRAVNAAIRAMLQARYEAYRRSGLKAVAPYARGGNQLASPGDELALALRESLPAAQLGSTFEALLHYPERPVPDMEHRFCWFKQIVENRPTFILAHRATRRGGKAALFVERQYYVGHSYNSNFIAAGGLSVHNGTLVFYCARTFTDQVANTGSTLKHRIGRRQMLAEATANLKRVREQLESDR